MISLDAINSFYESELANCDDEMNESDNEQAQEDLVRLEAQPALIKALLYLEFSRIDGIDDMTLDDQIEACFDHDAKNYSLYDAYAVVDSLKLFE